MFYALPRTTPDSGLQVQPTCLSDISTVKEAASPRLMTVPPDASRRTPSSADNTSCGLRRHFGEGDGPMVVAAQIHEEGNIKGKRIARPRPEEPLPTFR